MAKPIKIELCVTGEGGERVVVATNGVDADQGDDMVLAALRGQGELLIRGDDRLLDEVLRAAGYAR